jgi:hypothetical protein
VAALRYVEIEDTSSNAARYSPSLCLGILYIQAIPFLCPANADGKEKVVSVVMERGVD